VAACLIGADAPLAQLWSQHGEIGSRLRENGFDAVIAPAFSTWHNVPALDGLFSVAKTMSVASHLARFLPTVPTLAWRTGRDIERQLDWLRLGTAQLPAFAVDMAARAPWHFDWLVAGLRLISARADVGVPVRLVAVGVAHPDRMAEISRTWSGPLTFASSAAYHRAKGGDLISSAGGRTPMRSLSPLQLFEQNMARLNSWSDAVLARRQVQAA